MTRPQVASVCAWGPALVLSVMLLLPALAGADPGDEAALFNQLAAARARARVGALTRSGDLDAVARRHAARVAGSPQPFHNAGLAGETGGWVAVGEVVGRITAGPGWDGRLQQLFLASPTHRRVTLSATFTMVGIGVARSPSGDINTVEVFGRPSGTRPPRAPRAARATGAPAPRRPAPPAAPVTAPPTTTTTAKPLSQVALAPLPPAPAGGAPLITPALDVVATRAGAARPLTVGAVAAQLLVLGTLVPMVSGSRSRRAGRRRPWC